MQFLKFIIPPIIGAIIGYITNDIAIRMLFHPRKPWHIGKWRVPLTPGLIPKEKDRIGKSIGNMVSNQLLDSKTLSEVFTSDEMLSKMRSGIEEFIENNRDNNDTIEEAISKFIPVSVSSRMKEDLKSNLSTVIHSKLTSLQFGKSISKTVLLNLKEKIDSIGFELIGLIGSDLIIDNISDATGYIIDKIVADNSKEIIAEIIGNETENIMGTSISEIIYRYNEKLPSIIDFILNAYKRIIKDNLSDILKNINLAKIVEDKIASLNVAELEKMLFSIMKRELKAIVYLGALLGFIMGWLNLLLSLLYQ